MPTFTRWILAGLCLALAACDDAAPLAPGAADVPEPAFGIEPEPFHVFEFEAAGPIDGRWVGTLGDPAAGPGGTLAAQAISTETLGTTVLLVQAWTLIPPDPIEPVTATLQGTLNLVTGKLVLNGRTADGDILRVQGQAVDDGSGGLSIGGDVMFNPQPEPPGHV
jgi:hypothetical protein